MPIKLDLRTYIKRHLHISWHIILDRNNTDCLHTQNYDARIIINVRIHRFKTRSAAASTVLFSITGSQCCLVMVAHSNTTDCSVKFSFRSMVFDKPHFNITSPSTLYYYFLIGPYYIYCSYKHIIRGATCI